MNTRFENISKEKRKRIIDGAFKEFAFYGFENSSTNRLITDIGISKGSLFKYFSTKVELYRWEQNGMLFVQNIKKGEFLF